MKYNTQELLGNVFPTLQDGEYITIFKTNDECNMTKHFRNIEEALEWANKGKEYYNTYFNLSITDGQGRKADNQVSRHCIALDFDSKDFEDLSIDTIIKAFKQIRLYYHAVVKSGHGYHVYIFIEPTKELDLVSKTTKAIAQRVGADMKATLTTQVLRVPNTFNINGATKEPVKIIHIAENIILKPIEYYARNYYTVRSRTQANYFLNDKHTPHCIKDMLTNGIPIGSRNEMLQILVPTLRNQGKTLAEIKLLAQELIDGDMSDFDYQVEYLFNNMNKAPLNCQQCPHKGECYSCYIDYSEGKYLRGDVMIIHESIVKKFMTRNKGNNVQLGNSILFYALMEKFGELDKTQLESMTLFSKDTVKRILKKLTDEGFIKTTTKGRKKYYSAIKPKIKYDYTFTIDLGILTAITNGEITSSEFGVYCYMKLANSERQRKYDKAIKGNVLQITQEDIVKALNVGSRDKVINIINKLLDEQILSLYDRKKNADSFFMYNIYLLNY